MKLTASYRWYKVESQPTTAFTIQNTWCWSQLSVTGPRGCQNGQRSSSKRRRGRRRGRWGHDEKPVVNATTRHSGLCVGVFLPVLVFFLIVRQVTRYYMYFDILYNILYVYWFWIYSISVYAFLKRVSRVSSLLFLFWVYSLILACLGGPIGNHSRMRMMSHLQGGNEISPTKRRTPKFQLWFLYGFVSGQYEINMYMEGTLTPLETTFMFQNVDSIKLMKTDVPPNQIKYTETCWRCDNHLNLPTIANRFQWCHLAVFCPGEQVCPRKHMASGILAWSNDGENPEMLRLLDFYDLSMEVSGPLTSMDLWQMRETFCF